MRISWLSAEEITLARRALTAGGASWDDHFAPDFVAPPQPQGRSQFLDWPGITEHVARAERVSEIVREHGLDAARARFATSDHAIEVATIGAAAHENDSLELSHVIRVLHCTIDSYVFYAPFLELLLSLGRSDLELAVETYEQFTRAYAEALTMVPHGKARASAVRDGLADVYVVAGKLDDAQSLFEARHYEDPNDVAVALSASRAFLQAGSVSLAVRWLADSATATSLGSS